MAYWDTLSLEVFLAEKIIELHRGIFQQAMFDCLRVDDLANDFPCWYTPLTMSCWYLPLVPQVPWLLLPCAHSHTEKKRTSTSANSSIFSWFCWYFPSGPWSPPRCPALWLPPFPRPLRRLVGFTTMFDHSTNHIKSAKVSVFMSVFKYLVMMSCETYSRKILVILLDVRHAPASKPSRPKSARDLW